MSDIRIVKVETDAQWDQMRPLLKDLMNAMKELRPQRKDVDQVFEQTFRHSRANSLNPHSVTLFAVDDQNQAIGFLSGCLETSDGLDQGHDTIGRIVSAYIRPEYRNYYTFKKMGLAAARHFKALGLDRVSFSTLATNTRMQELFIALGFKPHKVTFELPLEKLIDQTTH